MNYQYRKEPVTQTFYRISISDTDNALTYEGIRMRNEGYVNDLQYKRDTIFSSDEKDRFHAETVQSSEEEFTEWLDHFMQKHDEAMVALLPGNIHKRLRLYVSLLFTIKKSNKKKANCIKADVSSSGDYQ